MLDHLIQFFINYGYFAVFGVLFLSGLGLPLPEDVTLVAGGFISSLSCPISANFFYTMQHCHNVHIMFIVSMIGVLIGDSCMFIVGRLFGPKVLNIKLFAKLISQARYEWAQEKFAKHGALFVFAARFMPGLRCPIFIITGITRKVSYLKFFLTDATAAIVSVPIWIYFGFWAERKLNDLGLIEHYVKRGQLSILIILGLIVAGAISFLFIKRKIRKKYNF